MLRYVCRALGFVPLVLALLGVAVALRPIAPVGYVCAVKQPYLVAVLTLVCRAHVQRGRHAEKLVAWPFVWTSRGPMVRLVQQEQPVSAACA